MKSFPKLWYKNLSGQTGEKSSFSTDCTVEIIFIFVGGLLTTNCRPLAVSVVCPRRAVGQQFRIGPDRFVVRDVLLSVLILMDILLQ